jgi:lipoprotein-releasing system ATP-binding protein
MSVLKLTDIKRSFTQGHKTIEVLKGVNLTVEKGELIALVGTSGSGKSTLLQIAGLLDSEFEGALNLSGEDVSKLKDDSRSALRREKLGFIYQFHHLLPEFTAEENVALALTVGGEAKSEALKKARATLDRLNMGHRMDHVPSRLSGGEQQRVAIARAVVGNPALLLADEPTGNLDEETAAKVVELFIDYVKSEGLSAIIATHDKSLAAKLDRQFHLREGTLVSQ